MGVAPVLFFTVPTILVVAATTIGTGVPASSPRKGARRRVTAVYIVLIGHFFERHRVIGLDPDLQEPGIAQTLVVPGDAIGVSIAIIGEAHAGISTLLIDLPIAILVYRWNAIVADLFCSGVDGGVPVVAVPR
jgi:hypothetical protein